MREYRAKNKERLNEQSREYYAKNKKRICEQHREYRAKKKVDGGVSVSKTEIELKSCPFCGGMAILERTSVSFHVYCNVCGATVGSIDNMDFAIDAWNRRVMPQHESSRIAKLWRNFVRRFKHE